MPRKKYCSIITLSFLFCFLPAFSLRADSDGVTLERAIDGETVELSDGRIVRLLGVETIHVQPILARRFKAKPAQLAGMPLARLSAQAMDYIQNQVVGRNVILSFDPIHESKGHRDDDDALLGYIWYTSHYKDDSEGESLKKGFGIRHEDRLLNAELIQLGFGVVNAGTPPFLQQELFLKYEKQAARDRRGFWRTAAELYHDILEKAQGSRTASVADFVPQDTREMGLKTAWKAYTDLIKANPRDYRPYYERSWLGASAILDRISEDNMRDIEQAISMSPYGPKSFFQKHYLLRLLGRHGDAAEAYTQAVRFAGKFGMPLLVSDTVDEDLKSGTLAYKSEDPERKGLLEDALRAGLNEDHFLFFMSRIKGYGRPMPDDVQDLYQAARGLRRFEKFYARHKHTIEGGSSHNLIYKTQWAQYGLEQPESILKWMETIGEAPTPEKSEESSSAKPVKSPASGSKSDVKDLPTVASPDLPSALPS